VQTTSPRKIMKANHLAGLHESQVTHKLYLTKSYFVGAVIIFSCMSEKSFRLTGWKSSRFLGMLSVFVFRLIFHVMVMCSFIKSRQCVSNVIPESCCIVKNNDITHFPEKTDTSFLLINVNRIFQDHDFYLTSSNNGQSWFTSVVLHRNVQQNRVRPYKYQFQF
jgi:hypothetical protein